MIIIIGVNSHKNPEASVLRLNINVFLAQAGVSIKEIK